jgi:hypothetical protein
MPRVARGRKRISEVSNLFRKHGKLTCNFHQRTRPIELVKSVCGIMLRVPAGQPKMRDRLSKLIP